MNPAKKTAQVNRYDGTDRLCFALYGRKPKAADYIGGSNARMLHHAAERIEDMKKGK